MTKIEILPVTGPNTPPTFWLHGNCPRNHRILAGIVVLVGLFSAGCDPKSGGSPSAAKSVRPPAQAAAPQAKGTVYQCPMHPNVTADKPGKCPVCGMNLEPVSHSHGDSSLAMKESANHETCSPESACNSKNLP